MVVIDPMAAPTLETGVPPTTDGGQNEGDWQIAENPKGQMEVYLVTFAKILETSASDASSSLRTLDLISRENIRDAMLDAFAHPVLETGGRPRKQQLHVCKMVVFLEEPKHFHVAVKLNCKVRFLPYKNALRLRHQLASHWSPSHTMWWSAVRYGTHVTKHKRLIDSHPLCYSADGRPLRLYEESQEPWCAAVAKRRREQAVCQKNIDTAEKTPKRVRFTVLDLKNTILAESLFTPAAILRHCQERGDEASRDFVAKNQRKLQGLIEEAQEWRDAKTRAQTENLTGWQQAQAAARTSCRLEERGQCTWKSACLNFFERNTSISSRHLAVATAKVLSEGPSKTARVPLLVGPSNSGKSTIFDPVDVLFGAAQVFHTPAVGSMALANLAMRPKAFIYLDDYRPVEYASFPRASPAVPVPTLLKLLGGQSFEVKVSGSFQNGNPDICWKKGIVITAKAEGLWDCVNNVVTREDIRHMQSRVEQFTATEVVQGALREVSPCRSCFCRWLVAASAEVVVPAPIPLRSSTLVAFGEVDDFLQKALAEAVLPDSLPVA